jgi:CDP-diglyceride synthetase
VPVDANLSSRVLTAAVGVPLLIVLVVWSPPWLFAAIFFIVMVGALHEYFTIAFPNRSGDQGLGIGFLVRRNFPEGPH